MATIIGNNRNNILSGTNTADTILGRGGNDFIDGRAGSDRINGGSGNDEILGRDGNDRIDGGRGNDTIDGGSGNDVIDGGSGNDQILGGDGNDRIDGGSGNDVIDGGTGNDIIDGGSGNDQILGGDGNDIVDGGTGNDSIDGGSGSDLLFGGSGNDQILGGAGNDILDGGSGNDVLGGGSGNDLLFGGAGDDALIGGTGADQLTGGSGSDRFIFLNASDSPTASGWDRITDFTQGRDRIDLSALLGPADLAWGNMTAVANGAWYQNSGSRTFVFADTNGDGAADLTIELTNTPRLMLASSDFIGVGGAPGVNSAPVVASTDVTGAVTEPVTPVGTLTDSGTIAFTDADLADIHSVSAVTPSSGALGSLTASVSTDTTGSGAGGVVTWNYSVAAADVDFLAAGQHQIETFTFEVLDAHGGSVSRTVSLDITGTNEAPVVASTDVTGAVTEPVTPVGTLTDSGTIAFTDADLADIHSVSAVTPSSGALGSLTASVSTDTTGSGAGGLVTWNYSVAAADVDFLAAGQHQIETFTFEVLDAHGGSVSRTVSLDITGTNEAPVVASTDVTGAVTEPVTPVGTLTDSGTIAFTDADLADIHSVSAVTPSSGALGSLTASVSTDTTGSGAGGLVTWNYSVAAADVDFLAAGQHQIETFTFEVLDGTRRQRLAHRQPRHHRHQRGAGRREHRCHRRGDRTGDPGGHPHRQRHHRVHRCGPRRHPQRERGHAFLGRARQPDRQREHRHHRQRRRWPRDLELQRGGSRCGFSGRGTAPDRNLHL